MKSNPISWKPGLRLVLDGAICLADSFEFTTYHCTRLKAFRHERASLNRIAADKSLSVIVALVVVSILSFFLVSISFGSGSFQNAG